MKKIAILLGILIFSTSAYAERLVGKYGQAKTVDFCLYKLDGSDLRSDASFASGDCKVMLDEAAETNCANSITDEGQCYSLVLSTSEMTAARTTVIIKDQDGTMTWLPKSFSVETYGHSSGEHAFDLDSSTVTLADDGITAAKIAADAIGSSEIATGAIDADAIASNAITSAEIADGALTAAKFPEDGTAQTGSSSTITLASSGSSAVEDFYVGNLISIVSGTGAGQSRCINDYNGSTKVASVGYNWKTNPDATSKYAIISGSGTCDTTVGSLGTGAISASTFASGAITADAIATDAIDSAELSQAAADKVWGTAARTITGGTISTNSDKTGYTCSTVSDKTGYSLAASQTFSTTGAVGSVTNMVTANVTQISGDSTAADNCELMFDGTGYAGGSTKLSVTASTVSDKTGYSLANQSITNSTFADNAITEASIAANAITTSEFKQDAADKVWSSSATKNINSCAAIGSGGITSSSFGSGAITATVLATDAIGSDELASSAITEISENITCEGGEGGTCDESAIADAVWDEMRSGHKIKGSFGEGVNLAPKVLK